MLYFNLLEHMCGCECVFKCLWSQYSKSGCGVVFVWWPFKIKHPRAEGGLNPDVLGTLLL